MCEPEAGLSDCSHSTAHSSRCGRWPVASLTRRSVLLCLGESQLPSASDLDHGDSSEVALPVLGLAPCDLSLALHPECAS